MKTFANFLVLAVALEHFYILYIEMFVWTTLGRKIFRGALEDELFEKTRGLTANQGLYNGFLATGLVWSFFIADPEWSFNVQIFFLSCVIVAAIFGALRSSKSILFKQGFPAIFAIIVVLLAHYAQF